jgi:hypothetical protein
MVADAEYVSPITASPTQTVTGCCNFNGRDLTPAPLFRPSLIDLYSSDEESPYHDLRHKTQRIYDQQLKLLKTSVGARRIDRLNGEDFRLGIASCGNLKRRGCRRGSGGHTAV